MSRTVKAPEDRRKELMMAAYELFMNRGYEETSVNSIIEKIGVAKGTFYHYFSSKEEILEAILTASMDEATIGLIEFSNRKDISSMDKLTFILTSITQPKYPEVQLSYYINDRKDDKLHMALENKLFQVFYPIILKVIKEGIYNGEFNIKFPEEITEVVIIGVQGFMHNHIKHFNDNEYAKIKLMALEELFTKILGSREKEFKFSL